ncbi:hypothetical protein SLEP1_g57882, partial [Rubroshorea leprosula]
MAAESTSK